MPGFQAFNALLCYCAIEDREKMKRGFTTLLQQQLPCFPDDERYLNLQSDEQVQLVLDVINNDALTKSEVSSGARQLDSFSSSFLGKGLRVCPLTICALGHNTTHTRCAYCGAGQAKGEGRPVHRNCRETHLAVTRQQD